MRKILITLLIVLTAPTLVSSQTINDIFKKMPESMLPGFSEANKTLLLVDTVSSTVSYSLGTIELTGYSNDFLSLKTSSVGSMQLKLLPLINDSKIVCVIRTVCSDFCDSDIRFYSTDWQILDKKSLMPVIDKELFLDMSRKNQFQFQEAEAKADILPVSMSLHRDNLHLTLSYNITDYLSKEDAKNIRPFLLKDKLTLSWNKSRFE